MAFNFTLKLDNKGILPYDFSDAFRVLDRYNENYYKQREYLDALEDAMGNLVLPEDSKYKEILDEYNQNFNAVSSRFAKGMDWRTDGLLRLLRDAFRQNIKPLVQMRDDYREQVKANQALRLLHGNDAIIGREFTLDDFYGGNIPDVGYRNGALIRDKALKYMFGVNNALMKDPTFNTVMSGALILIANRPGVDSAAILENALKSYDEATLGANSADIQDFRNHLINIYNSEAEADFTPQAKQLIWNNVITGAVSAIPAPTYSYQNNPEYESSAAREQRQFSNALSALTHGVQWNSSTREFEPINDELMEAVRKAQSSSYSPGIHGSSNKDILYINDPNTIYKVNNDYYYSSGGKRFKVFFDDNGNPFYYKKGAEYDKNRVYAPANDGNFTADQITDLLSTAQDTDGMPAVYVPVNGDISDSGYTIVKVGTGTNSHRDIRTVAPNVKQSDFKKYSIEGDKLVENKGDNRYNSGVLLSALPFTEGDKKAIIDTLNSYIKSGRSEYYTLLSKDIVGYWNKNKRMWMFTVAGVSADKNYLPELVNLHYPSEATNTNPGDSSELTPTVPAAPAGGGNPMAGVSVDEDSQ